MKLTNKNTKEKLASLAALTLAIIPILSPYELIGPFTISHIFIFSTAILSIIYTKKLRIIYPLFILFFIHTILSILAYYSRINDLLVENIFLSIIYTGINVFCIMQIISTTNKKEFTRISTIIATVACLFIFIQFSMMMMNINPPDGRIPGLQLDEYRGWANINIYNKYERRLHSFFAEPSYFAIYMLPALATSIKNKKYLLSIFFLIGLIISTSSLGILGSLVIIALSFNYYRRVRHGLLFISILLFVGTIWIQFGVGAEHLIEYNVNKILNLNQHSEIRIIGYLNYYKLLPDLQKFIGIGYNQLPIYFAQYSLKNYSNAFVLTLINHGFLGFAALLVFIIRRYVNLNSEDKIYVVIFFMICAIDAFLYNLYFYYILSFILLSNCCSKLYTNKGPKNPNSIYQEDVDK